MSYYFSIYILLCVIGYGICCVGQPPTTDIYEETKDVYMKNPRFKISKFENMVSCGDFHAPSCAECEAAWLKLFTGTSIVVAQGDYITDFYTNLCRGECEWSKWSNYKCIPKVDKGE